MGRRNKVRAKPAETRASLGDVYAAAAYPLTGADRYVSPVMAENLATVTACVNAISGALGALPAYVYRSTGTAGRVEAPEHPVSRLIRRPNSRQTWPDFCEWLAAEMLLKGNGLAIIEHDARGQPVELVPVPWNQVQVSVLPSGRLAYDVVAYTAAWGGKGTPRRLLEGDVLHVRDRSDDGYVGRSRLSRAPAALSSAIGLQTFSGAIWENAATPSGVLTVPSSIKPDDFRRMREAFEQAHSGAHQGGRVIFADTESRYTPMSVSPEDAEVLASRRFTVEELCRLMGVPPPIVQAYEFNTFTNASQANTWFATNTLRPIARKIEAAFSQRLFTEPGGEFHLEIDMAGLLRGDFATRWEANCKAVAAGILTADEVREAEGYAPRGSQDPARPDPGIGGGVAGE